MLFPLSYLRRHVGVAALQGEIVGRMAGLIAQFEIRAVAEQRCDAARVPVNRGNVKGTIPGGVLRVDCTATLT